MSGRVNFGRWLCGLSLAAALLFCAPLLRADGPAVGDPALGQKVDRLLADLDAEARSVRTAARESLLALGPAILPLLPAEASLPSAAARDAVAQIRSRLQRQSALATLNGTRVNLQGRFSLGEILHRISVETGNQFDFATPDPALVGREFVVDDRSRPFWSACDDIVKTAGLAYGPLQKRGSLTLIPARSAARLDEPAIAGELALQTSGPFRVAVSSAGLRFGVGTSRNLLRVTWNLMAEPRLRPLFASIGANRLVATGAASRRFKPATPTARWELSMGEGAQPLALDTDFEVPPGTEPASVEFRGSLGVEMAAGPERIVFDDLSAAGREKRRVGSVTVTLRSAEFPPATERPGTVRIEIGMAYDQGGSAFESYRTWMYHNEAVLETASGRRIAPRPLISTRQQGDGSVAVEYNFADVAGMPHDYRFVYVAPTLITEVPVEFRFPRIPVARPALEGTKR